MGVEEDDEEEESSFGLGKAVLIILMMFALGAVAGFGYFRLSAPKVHTNGNNNQQQSTPSPASSTTPSTTPSATTTPQADVRPADGPMVTALASAEAGRAYVVVVRPVV